MHRRVRSASPPSNECWRQTASDEGLSFTRVTWSSGNRAGQGSSGAWPPTAWGCRCRSMRSAPTDLLPATLEAALADGWGLRAASMAYVPEGGGSHHWRVVDRQGQTRFVTVDDLDDKDWLADTRE